ncbi:HesA/MoeB/ThiF family protein [Parasphingorhabdus cellanae]|uniref:HesA/MoeB/ThiF family protein n=1 Tax=Parasphingorhabdus cellanae TaxID=2806553 RepID=A0ABX7T404_9SPHN|nr:HesA/MoeB/ThiF family protein [Parasphingorhabdus cellanae]QTD55277.1 HesA/MoeB/ThiF family protein [Parasphingorhabdus cellanae]
MSDLTDEQLDRYARHIVLRDIGGIGQKKIIDAHILIIGAGGIGCPAIQYLAAAGIGALTIIDDDVVSLSNLQRQVLFTTADIGHPKVEVAKRAAQRINPEVLINVFNQRLTAQHFSEDAAAFFGSFDVIIDGSDNYQTRLLVSDYSIAHKVPLVSAAIGQFQGQLGIFRGWEKDKPCYRCFVGDALDPDDCDNCSEVGVLGAMVGLMGSFAATEAIRVVTGFGDDPAGKLQLFDGLKPSMRSINLPKDPECKSCGAPAEA